MRTGSARALSRNAISSAVSSSSGAADTGAQSGGASRLWPGRAMSVSQRRPDGLVTTQRSVATDGAAAQRLTLAR